MNPKLTVPPNLDRDPHPDPHLDPHPKVGRFFWGYMNTDRFTKFAVPDATVVGFSHSKKQQEFIGDCMEREAAEKMGRMRARPMWCSCNSCMRGRFDDCEMKVQMGGALRRVTTPLATGVQVPT